MKNMNHFNDHKLKNTVKQKTKADEQLDIQQTYKYK